MDPQWVLTAAHCFDITKDKRMMVIRLGGYDIQNSTHFYGLGPFPTKRMINSIRIGITGQIKKKLPPR